MNKVDAKHYRRQTRFKFLRRQRKIETATRQNLNLARILYILAHPSYPSLQIQMDFYSITVPAPAPEDFDNMHLIQLAQIETWNNDIMEIHWRPASRQILISIDDECIVQPDHINIVTSIATLFSCDDYQIRIKDLAIGNDGATPEELWSLYNSNWVYYAENNVSLQFRADVDYDADSAPQWVDIVPDSQPFAPMPYTMLD